MALGYDSYRPPGATSSHSERAALDVPFALWDACGEAGSMGVETMTAFRMVEWGRAPEFVEVPIPELAAGEVLVEVVAVGLCHTDVHLMHASVGDYGFPVPFTLGHEIAGRVVERESPWGELTEGHAVVVAAGPRCGICLACLRGQDNLCAGRTSGRGWGRDGGLARFVAVSRRELVPLDSLDPVLAAPLSDAGVTAFHAVCQIAPKLRGAATAVVIGVGGLGSLAVQFLRQLTGARVVAIDAQSHRLAAARELGADHALLASDATHGLDELTRGLGVDVVLDFVGTSDTMDLAIRSVRSGGAVGIVGAAGGTVSIGWGRLPNDCDVFIPMGGTTADLHDVVALVEAGRITIDIERFAFADVVAAYAGVQAGEIHGRAVVEID